MGATKFGGVNALQRYHAPPGQQGSYRMATQALRLPGIGEATVLTVGLSLFCYMVFVASPIADGQATPAIYYWIYAISVAPGLLLLPVLYVCVHAADRWPRYAKIALVVVAAMALSLVHAAIDAVLVGAFVRVVRPGAPNPVSLGGSLIIYVWVYGMFAAVVGLILSNYRMQRRELLLAETQQVAQRAQMAALRYQLNPHFLFNTLNAISSLIVTRDNDRAEAMMDKLSDFLRTTLVADPHAFVTLEEELDTVRTYLDIERVRFSQRLMAEVDCPAALRHALAPSFVLQPLVENAIRYAVAPSRVQVTIRITAEARGDDLVLRVEDDGAVGQSVRAGSGVGLANVRERLAVLYGERGRLQLPPRPSGFAAEIALPFTLGHPAGAAA